MKKSFWIRSIFVASMAAIGLAGMLTLSSCDKEDDDDDDMPNQVFKLSGEATGAQEVPPTPSTGTGAIAGTYDQATKSLIYTVTWTGISGEAIAAHFHGPAAVGETATPMQDITIVTNGTAGTATDTVTVSTELHSALLSGKVYYNIHTADFPDGEIRGQVILRQ